MFRDEGCRRLQIIDDGGPGQEPERALGSGISNLDNIRCPAAATGKRGVGTAFCIDSGTTG